MFFELRILVAKRGLWHPNGQVRRSSSLCLAGSRQARAVLTTSSRAQASRGSRSNTHAGQELKAIGQLWSLIGAAGLLGSEWQEAAVAELGGQSQSAEAPEIILVGFSKGGVVLNQILADAAHCCCGDDSRGGPSAGGAG
eukprot:CAMPEP_0177609766 /NCGR_PEP_ID=MMETSP0419_2-20121207/19315_1 /TAXON_ID=582737 /ORGANISM="Tetraselmis sp., Strain GSL018" /LENGTH=139 /DNA_ID=CAMNT_0019104815 /DNA_START=274 /DNA_END=689 /DNA_ORIENTATION=+